MRLIPCFSKFLSKAKVVTRLIKRIWWVSYWLFLLEPTEAPQLQPCKASCGERLNVTLTWTVGADILTTLKYKILNSSKLSRGRVFGMCTQYVWCRIQETNGWEWEIYWAKNISNITCRVIRSVWWTLRLMITQQSQTFRLTEKHFPDLPHLQVS